MYVHEVSRYNDMKIRETKKTCIYYIIKICFAMVSTMYVNIIKKKNNKIKTTTTKNKTKTKQNKKKCKHITQSEQFQILIDKM